MDKLGEESSLVAKRGSFDFEHDSLQISRFVEFNRSIELRILTVVAKMPIGGVFCPSSVVTLPRTPINSRTYTYLF